MIGGSSAFDSFNLWEWGMQPLSSYPCTPDSSPSYFAYRKYVPEEIEAKWPVIVYITGHGFTDGQMLRATKFISMPYAVATGMEQLNGRMFIVQNATNDTFELWDTRGYAVDGRGYTPYVSGGQFTLVGPELPIVNVAPEPPRGVPDPFV